MRINLRNEHTIVWLLLGPALLVFVVLAWRFAPDRVTSEHTEDSDTLEWSFDETADALTLNIEITSVPVLPSNFIVVAPEPVISLHNGVVAGQLHHGHLRVSLPDTVRAWSQVHVAIGDLLRDSIIHRIVIQR